MTNLTETVAAHVAAALIDTDAPYPPPVDELLRLGDSRRPDQEARIAELGLTQAHVADIVRLARDRRLNEWAEDDEQSPDAWGPVNAVLALKQLDVSAQAAEVVSLLDLDSDWTREEVPRVLGRAGAAAVAPLRAYLQDESRWGWGRIGAGTALADIGKQHPELRGDAIEIISAEVARAGADDREITGFLITDLVTELEAVEALPTIRQAFEQDRVDESIMGDWLDVLKRLGQEVDAEDPLVVRYQALRQSAPERRQAVPGLFNDPHPSATPQLSAAPAARTKAGGDAKKRKNKRKASAAARKTNKQKRK